MEEKRPELRLPDEDDAQELLGRGLEVREQAELLEHVDVEGLRLVDDDHGAPALLPQLQEMRVQEIDERLLARARRRQAELGVDGLEELERRERGIEDVAVETSGPRFARK